MFIDNGQSMLAGKSTYDFPCCLRCPVLRNQFRVRKKATAGWRRHRSRRFQNHSYYESLALIDRTQDPCIREDVALAAW
jgi:hypothetical protein